MVLRGNESVRETCHESTVVCFSSYTERQIVHANNFRSLSLSLSLYLSPTTISDLYVTGRCECALVFVFVHVVISPPSLRI